MKTLKLTEEEHQLAKAFIESAISVLKINQSTAPEIFAVLETLKIKFEIQDTN